ncbi:formylglycine-generating enzyme family protein [Actinoplanes missouriensis]|uniref:formylglycine-generating enzyme family protein n=1 Tax=Actinoplanes missouriensis TaxID=1866 RepID=UPI003F4CCF51
MTGPEPGACCSPARAGGAPAVPRTVVLTPGRPDTGEMIELGGGRFLMGTDDADGFPADGEGPVRAVTVSPFRIAPVAVTNARFAEFAAGTGYVTEAERTGWSFVFAGLLPDDFPPTRGVRAAPWWRQVEGADWRHPEGPQSAVGDRVDHPVVHVAHTDAVAYCRWAGVRLPTEAEWEFAARGGLEQARFPWGDEPPAGRCNIWEGTFPSRHTGSPGTAPVRSYQPNGYGLYNVAGNVWEWCSDWFSPTFHRGGPHADPIGPPAGTARVIRGGSYLCHESYCNRYRVAARSQNTPDSSTGNTGFRVVATP